LLTAALLVLSFFVGDAGPWLAGLAMLPLPIAVAIGIAQHGLWDTDGLLRKTLAGGALSGVLLIVYVGIVAVASALFEHATAGASLIATGVIAVLMLPAHRRATRWANGLVYGAPEDPATVIGRLGRELDSSARPGDALASACATVADATGATHVSIIVEGDTIASVGNTSDDNTTDDASTDDEIEVPLHHARETIGALRVGGLPANREQASRRLLADLAPHIALVAHAQQLELEVVRSHDRLVAAREDERARLQRDLHDGVGPMMAALALELDRGRLMLEHDPASGEAVFNQLAGHLREAVRAVRTLVHDLRPPPLDELGLAGALAALANQLAPTTPSINVAETGLDRTIPADVELAAYRIAGEAMTNVGRHAAAAACDVSLIVDDARLVVEVRDDGVGLDHASDDGMGRSSMKARAEEHGGTIHIASGPAGTTVTAVLPLNGQAIS
jgi:signal transduction histidine kinase